MPLNRGDHTVKSKIYLYKDYTCNSTRQSHSNKSLPINSFRSNCSISKYFITISP